MMKHLYQLLEIACLFCGLSLFLYGGALLYRMSFGYEGGWTAAYCLPRVFAAGAGIIGLIKLADAAEDAAAALEEAAKREATYSGMEPRDWRRGA